MDNLDGNARLIVYGHHLCGLALKLEEALKKRYIDYEWRDVLERLRSPRASNLKGFLQTFVTRRDG